MKRLKAPSALPALFAVVLTAIAGIFFLSACSSSDQTLTPDQQAAVTNIQTDFNAAKDDFNKLVDSTKDSVATNQNLKNAEDGAKAALDKAEAAVNDLKSGNGTFDDRVKAAKDALGDLVTKITATKVFTNLKLPAVHL